MKPELKAVVHDVEVEAEYQGNVYEQTVVLETEHDTVAVFDSHTTVTEDDIGESHSFVILINPQEDGSEIVAEDTRGIAEREERTSKWSYDFYGEIVETEVEDTWFREKHDNLLLLNIGEGTVLLLPTESMVSCICEGNLGEGDVLRVSGARTDLIDILG